MGLFEILGRSAGYFENTLKTAVSPVGPYLRRLGLGFAFLIISAVGWIIALIFFLMAFFFSLSSQTAFINPALWTGAVGVLAALVCLFVGLGLVRRPR